MISSALLNYLNNVNVVNADDELNPRSNKREKEAVCVIEPEKIRLTRINRNYFINRHAIMLLQRTVNDGNANLDAGH